MKKRVAWNKGLTKETDERVRKYVENRESRKGKIWEEIFGKEKAQYLRKNNSEKLKGTKISEEHKRKISNANKGNKYGKNNKGNKRPDLSLMNSLKKGKKWEELYGEEKTKKIKKILSIKRKGDRNANWRGGIMREPYPFKFNRELKEKIRKRDKYICQLCGEKQKEFKMKNRSGKVVFLSLGIHHIDYNKQNCKDNNLISLCRKCNSFVNFERRKWTKFFQEKLL